jgi:Tfp pilus assembly protein PilF
MLNTERIEKLFELLKTEPNDIFLNYALGIEYIANPESYSLAEEQFKKVLLLNPEYIAVYYQLGKLFEAQAKNVEALEYYKIGLTKAREQKNNKAINEFGEAVFMLED